MKKFLLAFIFLALFAPWCLGAEQTEIFVIFSSDIDPYRQAFDGFKKALLDRRVSYWTMEYTLDKEEADVIVQQIFRKRPVLILTIGPEASRLAKEKIRDIPVVFSMVLHPEAFTGLNITGVSLDIPFKVKLDNIRRILPGVRKLGVIYSQKSAAEYKEIAQGCKDTGLQLVGREIASVKEFPDAFKEISRQIDSFLMIADTRIYFQKSIEYLLSESLKNRLPVIGLSSSYTRAGALFSFDMDYIDLGRRAGEIAAKIMVGERPANMVRSRPDSIRFSLNLVVAERLGIKIPPRVLREASEVFGK